MTDSDQFREQILVIYGMEKEDWYDPYRYDERNAILTLLQEEITKARVDENTACQAIIRSKWGTNDQLWDMQDRIKQLQASSKEEQR